MHELPRRGFEELNREFDNARVRHLPGPQQQLVGISVTYVSFALANQDKFRLMYGGVVDTGGDPGLLQAACAVNQLLVEVINSGTGPGVFRERDATELALVAWTSMHGLATLQIAGSLDAEPRDTEQLSMLVRRISRNILYGISK